MLNQQYSDLVTRERDAQRWNELLASEIQKLIDWNRTLSDRQFEASRALEAVSLSRDDMRRETDNLHLSIKRGSQELIRISEQFQSFRASFDDRTWLVKEAKGLTLLLDKRSMVDLHIFYHDRWEERCLEYLLEAMQQAVRDNQGEVYFLDIGSYLGQCSLVVKQQFPEIIVTAFEANPYNYIHLQANFLINDLVDEIRTINCCVTDVNGQTTVDKPDVSNKGATSVGKCYDGKNSKTVVSNLIMNDEFSFITNATLFIKKDIEGSEHHALAGMRRYLARTRSSFRSRTGAFPLGISVFYSPIWDAATLGDPSGLFIHQLQS